MVTQAEAGVPDLEMEAMILGPKWCPWLPSACLGLQKYWQWFRKCDSGMEMMVNGNAALAWN